MRTVGVEEELLLADATSGRPLSVSGRVLRRAAETEAETASAGRDDPSGDQPGSSVGSELQQQQVETDTHPHTDLGSLEEDLRSWRTKSIAAARAEGALVVAVGTSPVIADPTPVERPRTAEMFEQFGLTTAEQLTCGCHVHVSVDSNAEGVGVLDRIRVWLPTLLALSANSPFWQGQDTRYASYRAQVISRWPSAGPTPVFGSADAYQNLVAEMVGSSVLLDEGMVYFDARLSSHYPTVEIRVADVCLDPRDAVLLAALCRGLVDTAAGQWQAGEPGPTLTNTMLRLATWQASRHGLDGALLDPNTCRPRPAREVLGAMIEHIRPALRSNPSDAQLVEGRLDEVLSRGNGAHSQRTLFEKTSDLPEVVSGLAQRTAG